MERPLVADIVAKSFWDDERKLLEPLMRFTRGEVGGLYRFIQNRSRVSVVALKSDATARSPKINFREIFWVVRFSTFATISARSGHSVTAA
jgi:hypothetical protein